MTTMLLALAVAGVLQAMPAPIEKVDIVAAVGCLREESPDAWMLVNASDPVVSTANAPTPNELASLAKSGKNQYRLTGVSIFSLSAHRGHTVLIKGLHIKAVPVSRLNVTSVTMVSAECPAK